MTVSKLAVVDFIVTKWTGDLEEGLHLHSKEVYHGAVLLGWSPVGFSITQEKDSYTFVTQVVKQ